MWKKEAPTKYITSLEFRYLDEETEYQGAGRSITITVGIYDTKEEAANAGNEAIKQAGEDFVASIDKSGYIKRDRLDHRGPYGSLVRHWHRKQGGVEYFASIKAIKFYQVAEVLEEVMTAQKRYRTKKSQEQAE